MLKRITVHGARQHNLKNIDVEIPRNSLTVITGLSGSGKSSLAFDTIYAEGQRRYVDTLSAYARQFLDQMERPDVDSVEGLSPSIAIEQKTTTRSPRSTVGTITEIYDYLRVVYSAIGTPHCPNCGKEIASQSLERIVDMVMLYPQDERINVLAPIVRSTAISARLSFTSMISEDTTLNAATSTIMPSTMNMVSFCTCSTPTIWSLACRQSRISSLRPARISASGRKTASTCSGSATRI